MEGLLTDVGEQANENDSDSVSLFLCCLRFTFNALSAITRDAYHFSLLLSLVWNLMLKPSLCNVLHITEPIYLRGHIHIFIHSHSHQAWHQETLNQDSPFKQTNELWITSLHKLPSSECYRGREIGWVEKWRENEKHCGAGRRRVRPKAREENTDEGGWDAGGQVGVWVWRGCGAGKDLCSVGALWRA